MVILLTAVLPTPKLAPAERVRIPALTVMFPVYVLAAPSVKVPVPDFTRAPLPLITPLRVWFADVAIPRVVPEPIAIAPA